MPPRRRLAETHCILDAVVEQLVLRTTTCLARRVAARIIYTFARDCWTSNDERSHAGKERGVVLSGDQMPARSYQRPLGKRRKNDGCWCRSFGPKELRRFPSKEQDDPETGDGASRVSIITIARMQHTLSRVASDAIFHGPDEGRHTRRRVC